MWAMSSLMAWRKNKFPCINFCNYWKEVIFWKKNIISIYRGEIFLDTVEERFDYQIVSYE